MKNKILSLGKWIVLAVFVLVAGVYYSSQNDRNQVEESQVELLTEEAGLAEATSQETALAKSSSAEIEETLYIYVCGEVNVPGVYCMKKGQRIYEAVELAGGFTDRAAESYWNLALPVEDGMKIQVPDADSLNAQEAVGEILPQADSQKVNLNTATKEELMTLTGIGQARAEEIIRYREQKGGFSKIEEVMEISGIKDGAFQKIKDDITV